MGWVDRLRGLLVVTDEQSPEARLHRLVFDAVLLGVLGAVFAQLFIAAIGAAQALLLRGIAGYVPPGTPAEGGSSTQIVGPHGLWLIPVSTTLAGLVVGWITERFAPEAEGHGTDALIKAFHRADGELRPAVGPVKLLASALTIGSGGSAGREGPMGLITGSVGSWYATRTGRSGEDRRLLVLVGMAAGISAIFRSPIGAALLAVEILYADMEFEPGALLYTALGAIVAYAVNGIFVGWQPLFRFEGLQAQLPRTMDYFWYVGLGLAAGLVATALPVVFYRAIALFRRLPISPIVRPAVGGLVTGVIALALPQVLQGGYGWIQQAIDGRLPLLVLLVLVVGKTAAMSATVGSGGSGGVFAPALFVGAMLGGSFATLAHLPPAPFVVVGMAAVFAGAGHAPIATMMMVVEMTGGYAMLVPAALGVILSYLVQSRLSRGFAHRTLYEAQVPSPGDSPAHHTRHLEIALRILRERDGRAPSAGDAGDLALLRAGIPVHVRNGSQLRVGALRAGAALDGARLSDALAALAAEGLSIVALLHGEHMVAPRPELTLATSDKAIVLVGEDAAAAFHRHFTPW